MTNDAMNTFPVLSSDDIMRANAHGRDIGRLPIDKEVTM